MQGTAAFHYQITDPLLPQANAVLHDAAALDTAVDMLDPEPAIVQCLVGKLLLQEQLPSPAVTQVNDQIWQAAEAAIRK